MFLRSSVHTMTITITITEAITVSEAAFFPWRATDHCEDDRDRRWFN